MRAWARPGGERDQNRSDDGKGRDRKVPKTSISVGPDANVQREKEERERKVEEEEGERTHEDQWTK